MKLSMPEDIKGDRIYFTEADPALQIQEALAALDVIAKLKSWLLLCDHIIVSGTHIFGSSIFSDILMRYPRLLTEEAVLPYLRSGCSTFSDYLALKRDESGDYKPTSQDIYRYERVARFLDEHSNHVVVWKPNSAINLYKNSLIQELTTENSSLRQKLTRSQAFSILKLAERLSSIDNISRNDVNRLAPDYLQQEHAILTRQSDFFYYLWGAVHLRSEPVLHPSAFFAGRDNLQFNTNRFFARQGTEKSTNIRLDEPFHFDALLHGDGIDEDALARLTINDILDLRKDITAMRFRAILQTFCP
jgi:hypothetical protein